MTIQDAEILVARQIGVGNANFDGSPQAVNALSDQDEQALTGALLQYVRTNPGQFTAQQVGAANAAPRDASGQLTEQDYSIGDFIADAASGAGTGIKQTIIDPLAAVGNGVSTSVKLVGTLIPVLVILAIVVFAWPYIRRAFGK